MKISNSKKQLAKIIHANGGWREGNYAIQDKDDKCVWFMFELKGRPNGRAFWPGVKSKRIKSAVLLPNWRQTILSRDEYFHLYPAPDADGWIEFKGSECPIDADALVDVKTSVGDSAVAVRAGDYLWRHDGLAVIGLFYRPHKPEQSIEQICASVTEQNKHESVDTKPIIEQLAIAQQAQEEADSHRCGAEAALEKLVAAGKALGLVLSVSAPEPELVITDWRDLRVGDVVEVTGSDNHGWIRLKDVESLVTNIGPHEDDVTFCPRNDDTDWAMSDNTEWRFIRRPAKGGGHA